MALHSNQTDNASVETLSSHLPKIQHLQFDKTPIGSDSIKAISKFCGKTLKTLRVRGCESITSESCGWMAGAIGHNTPRLRKLRALDVASTQVDDRGLSFLCEGLNQLQCLDLGHCIRLTDRGFGNILAKKSFCNMRVLNLRGCKWMLILSCCCNCKIVLNHSLFPNIHAPTAGRNIGDGAVIAVCRTMEKMKHVNLSQCGAITNKAAAGLGSLVELETLSLEGATAVNDAGLGLISSRTKLNLLNVTGCCIARKSLLAVINTLGYVEEASHFYGFLIRSSDAKVLAIKDQENECTKTEQNQAVHAIQVSIVEILVAIPVEIIHRFDLSMFIRVGGTTEGTQCA